MGVEPTDNDVLVAVRMFAWIAAQKSPTEKHRMWRKLRSVESLLSKRYGVPWSTANYIKHVSKAQ